MSAPSAAGSAGSAGSGPYPPYGKNSEKLRGESGERTRQTRQTRHDPVAWLGALLAAVGSARTGRKWQCPAHGTTGEHAPSLSISRGSEGRLLLFCHAGCAMPDVLRALALPLETLWTPPGIEPAYYARLYLRRLTFPPPRVDHGPDGTGWVAVSIVEHPYGSPAFAWKVRERNAAGTKRMRWESLNPHGERVPGLLGRREVDLPLYLERDVRMALADPDEPILLVESESSVDALVKAGFYATTWAGGAASAPVARLAELLGTHPGTLLIPDNDPAGRACAEQLVRGDVARRLLLGEPGEDARDLLARCGRDAFRALVDEHLHPTRRTA